MAAEVRVGATIDDPGHASVVLRTIRCVAGVAVLAAPLDKLGDLAGFSLLVVDRGTAALLRRQLEPDTPSKVMVVTEEIDDELLEMAMEHHQVVGLLVAHEQGPRPWELTYALRRLLNAAEDPPMLGTLLAWGATTVSWSVANLGQQRRMVDLIERTCVSLGIERGVADVVGTAAHELSMNAMFCPRDAQGQPRALLARPEDLTLPAEAAPEVRLTVDGSFIAIDCIDRFGQLPRHALFQSILRGRQSTLRDDSKEGRGAGLGLHTMFAAGSILRAEVAPGALTLMSWAYDRSRTGRTRRQTPRSLWFLPIAS